MTTPSRLRSSLRILAGLLLIALAALSVREALRSRSTSIHVGQRAQLTAIAQAQREMRDAYLARASALKKWYDRAGPSVQKSLPISPSELNSLWVESEGLALNSPQAFARFDWVQEQLNRLASALLADSKGAAAQPREWSDLERALIGARARFSQQVSEYNRTARPDEAYPAFAAEAALERERNP